jgi:serine/threonine-protein kinase
MQTLHKYQILEKIGVGGFGVVYKATDPFIKRFVAIKTCTSADPETRDRFVREAEIAGNLHHRNIVTVYDFGYHEETPYLVQEYLSGEDLDRKIKRREFVPLPAKILYLVQIARGLQYAHSKGVVHRDIKPANIRILEDDTAKIMDFGIAKLAKEQQSLTQAGITLGTAAYLAPEQIKGEPSGPPTDIFSFGALAYELIASERPFGGAEISAIFYRILNEEVTPLRRLAGDCPAELERIVHRCLEKDPARRYASCEELVHDLEELGRRRSNTSSGTFPRPSGAAGAAASPPSTSVVPTSGSAGRPDARTAPIPTPRPSSASERTRSLSLGDVVLDAPRAAPAANGGGLNTMAIGGAAKRGGSVWKTLLAIVLVGGAAFAAWRLRDDLKSAPGAPDEGTAIARPGVTEAPAAASPPVATAAPNAAQPTAPENDPSTALSTTVQGTPNATTPSPPSPEPVAAAAPAVVEPPPVRPAVLVVAPAWDSSMTVRVGRKSWPLDRERRFELEPGNYRLRFAIQTAVYSQEREESVRLAEGETKRISSPIARPGRLTVQPHLNTPQGHVRIDGKPAGPTPLRGKWLAPGTHLVEIAALPDASAPAILSETIEIATDQETLFTFDLDGRAERRISSRPALPN